MTKRGSTIFRSHDYSRWIREAIKDDELADELEQIEGQPKRRSESDPTLGARGDRAQVHGARVRAIGSRLRLGRREL